MTNRIKDLRAREGLTQVELADRVGVRHPTIGRMERGENDEWIERGWRLARALRCHPGELFAPLPNQIALSEDERAILEIYRGLDQERRATLLTIIRSLQPSPPSLQPRARKKA